MIIYKVSKLPMYPAVQPSALHLQVTICCRVQLTYHTQKDIVSGDEIISDTWNLKEIDDVVYEVDCKSITKGAEDNIGQSPNQVHPSTIRIIPVNRLTPILDRLNFLGEEASGTRLFGTKKDYLAQLKGLFSSSLPSLFRQRVNPFAAWGAF
jgi:hypothetical protein